MFRSMWCAMALAVAALPAQAQESDTAKMREELRQLQQRLQQLERRLQETEAKSGKAEEAAQRAESTAAQAAAQASSRPQTESALNPGVSVILNGVYGNFSRDPNTYRLNGFVPTMGDVAAGRGGLSLGEAEAAVLSTIGHNFPRRAFLLRGALPEPDPRARRGLRRHAPRHEGVPRQSAQRGRHPVQVGGADGPVL